MAKRKERVSNQEELAVRLAAAFLSWKLGITLGHARRSYIPKGREPGSFWLNLARVVMITTGYLHESAAKREDAIDLEDVIELWKQKGFILLGYVWINPRDLNWGVSFNPETSLDIQKAWSERMGIEFKLHNLLEDFRKQ